MALSRPAWSRKEGKRSGGNQPRKSRTELSHRTNQEAIVTLGIMISRAPFLPVVILISFLNPLEEHPFVLLTDISGARHKPALREHSKRGEACPGLHGIHCVSEKQSSDG